MVGIVAAVGGEVEGDGQAALPRLEVAAVEGVRFLRRREAGILAQYPGTRSVHRGARPAQIRREPRQGTEMSEAVEVFLGIERLDDDAFRRLPGQVVGRPYLDRKSTRLNSSP